MAYTEGLSRELRSFARSCRSMASRSVVLFIGALLLLGSCHAASDVASERSHISPWASLQHLSQQIQREPSQLAQQVLGAYGALSSLVTDIHSDLPQPSQFQSALLLPDSPAAHQDEPSRRPGQGSRAGRIAQAGQAPVADVSSARRQLAVSLPPIVLPPLPPANRTPPGMVILAPNRTHRMNPLSNFNYWTGGWDFYSADYWASLSWATVFGAIIGIVWTLFGLGFVFFLFVLCCCFPSRWRRTRDPALKYSSSHLILPALFMVIGLLTACAGLGLMITGGVQMSNSVTSISDFAVGQVTKVANAVSNISGVILAVTSQPERLNITFKPDVRNKLITFATKANETATEALTKAQNGGRNINTALSVIQKLLFILGCITVGLLLLGAIFGFCKLAVLSNIVSVIVWILCFITWVLVTVFLFIWLFSGDTSVAMTQVAYSPTDLSKFNLIVPCMDPQAVESVATLSRFLASTAIVVANTTIAQKAPYVFRVLQVDGICNPFGPAPNYTYNAAACANICSPYEPYCKGNQIDLPSLADRLTALKCNLTNTKQCQVLQGTTVSLRALVLSADNVVELVRAALPAFKDVLKCLYITFIANKVSDFVSDLSNEAVLLWVGFLLISVGAMVVAVCLPIYAYRAVRSYKVVTQSDEIEQGGSSQRFEPMSQSNRQVSGAGMSPYKGEESVESSGKLYSGFEGDSAVYPVPSGRKLGSSWVAPQNDSGMSPDMSPYNFNVESQHSPLEMEQTSGDYAPRYTTGWAKRK